MNKETIYLIRKHGAAKVSDKAAALEIVDEASEYGYIFKARKHGWAWIVEDKGE